MNALEEHFNVFIKKSLRCEKEPMGGFFSNNLKLITTNVIIHVKNYFFGKL